MFEVCLNATRTGQTVPTASRRNAFVVPIWNARVSTNSPSLSSSALATTSLPSLPWVCLLWLPPTSRIHLLASFSPVTSRYIICRRMYQHFSPLQGRIIFHCSHLPHLNLPLAEQALKVADGGWRPAATPCWLKLLSCEALGKLLAINNGALICMNAKGQNYQMFSIALFSSSNPLLP